MSHRKPPLTPAERAHCLAVRDRLAKRVCAPLDPQTGLCLQCGRLYEYIGWKVGFCSACRKVRTA